MVPFLLGLAAFIGSAVAVPKSFPLRGRYTNSSVAQSASSFLPSTTSLSSARLNISTSTTSSSSTLASPSAVAEGLDTLSPGFHWDHDPYDLDHLKPDHQNQLHWNPGSTNAYPDHGHVVVNSDLQFNFPTVVLDHSALISVTIIQSTVNIIFTSSEAYQIAKETWQETTTVILVTSASSDSGQYDYHQATSVVFDDILMKAVWATAQIALEEAIQHVHFQWGTYQQGSDSSSSPPSGNSPSGSSSSGSGHGSSSGPSGPGSGSGTGPSGSGSSGSGSNSNSDSGPSTPSSDSLTPLPTPVATDVYCGDYLAIPTATPGPDFDRDLDDALCYLVWSEDNFEFDIEEFANGLNDTDYADYTDGGYVLDEDGVWGPDGDLETSTSVKKRAPVKQPPKKAPAQPKKPEPKKPEPKKPEPKKAADPPKKSDPPKAATPSKATVPPKKSDPPKAATPPKVADPPKQVVKAAAKVAKKTAMVTEAQLPAYMAKLKSIYSDVQTCAVGITKKVAGRDLQPRFDCISMIEKWKSYLDGTVHPFSLVDKEFDFPTTSQVTYVDQTTFVDKDTNTPRKAFTLASKGNTDEGNGITVYCIDCGVHANLKIGGEVAYNLLEGGLQQAEVTLNGSLLVGVNLGVVARYAYKNTYQKDIARVPIPGAGFNIPQVLNVGPYIEIKADAKLEVEASGTLLAGGQLSLPNVHAVLDLKEPKNSTKPDWTPTFKKTFEAKGEVSIKADLALPVSLSVGVEILGKEAAKAAIISTPKISTGASYSGSIGGKPVPPVDGVKTDDCKNGISYFANVEHSLTAVVKFPGISDVDPWKLLDDYKYPLVEDACLKLGKGKRQLSNATYVNSTSVDDSVQDDSDRFITLVPYGRNETAPFPDIFEDDNNDGLVDDLGFEFPAELDTWLNTTGLATAQLTASTNSSAPSYNFNYTFIMDITNTFTLIYGDDGNLYINRYGANVSSTDPSFSLFAVYDDMVVGDSIGRTLLYYAPVMDAYNVSRIRLADDDSIPYSAEILSLAPLDYDNDASTVPIYAAFDTLGNMFYLAICTYTDGSPSKVFVVNDIEYDLDALASEELQSSVTGGPVDQCYPLALSSGQRGI
ncbi:hypothetical protein GQ53DRAFT_884171 [Thozetella sp. PMI_491]|nr:hypothetical protein GQ53DRAFT_884171 [Thozetella sp. PMI_491]